MKAFRKLDASFGAPTNLTLTSGVDGIQANWTPVAGATYLVFARSASDKNDP